MPVSRVASFAVRRLLVAAPLAGRRLVTELFPEAVPVVVALEDLRVDTPWSGRLFELLAQGQAETSEGPIEPEERPVDAGRRAVGLVVPVRWLGREPAPELVAVTDHVNLRLRGPLTGRSPVSGPQSFPSMSGLYQPETIEAVCRSAVRPHVYSVGAVAGVADAAHLTPFERRQAGVAGCPAVSDSLVDAAIVAALHGLKVAACGVPER